MAVWRRKEEPPDLVGAEPIAQRADLRPHSLTKELLDWAIAANEAVLRTPEFLDAPKRVRSAILDAYRLLDHLYPYIVEARTWRQPSSSQPSLPLGAAASPPPGPSSDSADLKPTA